MPAETIVPLLATTLLATGVILARLPLGQCEHCPHCVAEKLEKEREGESRAGRFYGMPMCSACGGHHTREEPHRRT